ncbi:MAG: TPM domain-containing protein [Prevotella sp.]|nr:TPM domain-containing protein [Prevotella sp.]
MSAYIDQLNQLTRQYNDSIRALEDSYNMENSQLGWNLVFGHITQQYSKKYDVLAQEYEQKKQRLLRAYQQTNPEWTKWRRRWSWIFFIGIILMMGSCIGQLTALQPTPVAQPISNTSDKIYWNVENIPIPHLQDANQYVSNPDHVLTQTTVDSMNVMLKRLDIELGIESVVIVVNHIENDDPFRLAQDVGNKYGVGREDRGLMVVVGYEDHSINISPGRSLEADLTDVECHRLEQQYVIPAMREEMPDSAMLYLTQAIYSTLQKKNLPVMSLRSQSDDLDDQVAGIMGIYMLLLTGWMVFFLRLNRKYLWFGLLGATSLLANPFYKEPLVTFGSGHGGFGRGGGSSFGGGSFGGGSFGGGGATSRW